MDTFFTPTYFSVQYVRAAAAFDGGADVEHDQFGIGEVLVEPLRRNERVGMGPRNRNGHGRTEQHGGTEPTDSSEEVKSN
jgi:hypothetical protein